MNRLLPFTRIAVLALLILPAVRSAAANLPATTLRLTTVAERSGFLKTGRYDEVVALCEAFAKHYPDAVRCKSFGTTPEGRPMKLLVVTRTDAFTPEAARAQELPVVLVQGGIHAGEIDGKDAGFLALRQMLEGEVATGDLDKQVLLFVPVFNVDGHENFRAWNRPNQRGPTEMGWRTTAQNYNLNRDYVKADTPEMQAMLALVDAWDPLATIDLHVTDGAKFQHGVSVEIEPLHAGDSALRKVGTAFRDGVIDQLDADGAMAVPFYPSFVEYDNPDSGFADGVYAPRFSNGYFQLRNRLGMLVETHSWKPYPTRVRITRNAIIAVLDQVSAHGGDWLRTAHAADQRATHLAGATVPLDWKTTDTSRMIDFQGYAWTRTPSDVSGAPMTHYDESTPQVWHVPLRDEVVPDHVASVPRGGYLVPAAHADWVGAKLRQHGITFRRIGHRLHAVDVQAWRARDVEFGKQSFEGHQRVTVSGEWQRETQDLAAGALFVPAGQPKVRLVMALLEPQAPDSLLAWGEFNNAFEQKEYMEPYVAEMVAREMLATDPALRAAFQQKLKDDPVFAKDPSARLDFFYRRHPSYDGRYKLYPVVRTTAAPE